MSASMSIPWRKRSIDSDSPIESKRPKNSLANCYYIKLASESSDDTDDDTESVYSIQGKETDIVKDSSEESDSSQAVIGVEIEYDIDSLSENDNDYFNSSSESELDIALVAAAVCDSSIETFITDAEDSDNSLQDDSSHGLRDYWTCIQCKSQNDNPQFRFCDKCFQDRKTFFPPRPRRHKKAKRNIEKANSPVKLEALQSCLSGLSQDSGLGSSQEFASLNLDQIQVPEHLSTEQEKPSTSVNEEMTANRKRCFSESSLSEDYDVVPRPTKKHKKENTKEEGAVSETKQVDNEKTRTPDEEVTKPLPELKEICIICNTNPKNSVFLHGRIAHMCCCYKCAMRTWKSLKRCPICNRKVSNVVRVFTT